MVRVELAADDPGEIVLGEKVQVSPVAGAHDRLIWPLKPPTAADPTVSFPEPPALTVMLCEARLREKSAPVAAAAGTSVANNPLVWLAPPAVKYNVLGSPVPPAPNTMSQSPGFVITFFAES